MSMYVTTVNIDSDVTPFGPYPKKSHDLTMLHCDQEKMIPFVRELLVFTNTAVYSALQAKGPE